MGGHGGHGFYGVEAEGGPGRSARTVSLIGDADDRAGRRRRPGLRRAERNKTFFPADDPTIQAKRGDQKIGDPPPFRTRAREVKTMRYKRARSPNWPFLVKIFH